MSYRERYYIIKLKDSGVYFKGFTDKLRIEKSFKIIDCMKFDADLIKSHTDLMEITGALDDMNIDYKIELLDFVTKTCDKSEI